MLDSSETRDSQWRDILWLYEMNRERYRPMIEFIRWLSESDYATLVSPSTSHLTLSLIANDALRKNSKRGALHIEYNGHFRVNYQEREGAGGFTRLEREYADDEIRPAVEAWLRCLQIETQWREI